MASVTAELALALSTIHAFLHLLSQRKAAKNLMTTAQLLPIIAQAFTQGAEFLAGAPAKINIPAESYTFSIPDFGDVVVTEPGVVITITKK